MKLIFYPLNDTVTDFQQAPSASKFSREDAFEGMIPNQIKDGLIGANPPMLFLLGMLRLLVRFRLPAVLARLSQVHVFMYSIQGTPYLIIDTIKYGWVNWCEPINAFFVRCASLNLIFSRIRSFWI